MLRSSWPSLALSACLVSILAVPAGAQPASLVRDIASEAGGGTAPSQLLAVGKKVFFLAATPGSGNELWVTDGTASGTEQLADACPGACGSDGQLLGSAGGLLYFRAAVHGSAQLWRSDGTRAGTFALTDGRGTSGFAAVGNAVFFANCVDPQGCRIWRTDGSRAGTALLQDPGTPQYNYLPLGPVALGGKVYFLVSAGDLELWRSDGTAAGTVRLSTFAGAFSPQALTVAAGHLFFIAPGPGPTQAIWASDGTAAGTVRVTSFTNSQPFQPNPWLLPYAGGVYFVADDLAHGNEVWTSDGTPGGTRRVTDFGFFDPFGSGSGLGISQLAPLGGRLVFVASDGLTGLRLWSTTGAPESTAPITPAGADLSYASLTLVGGRAVFAVSSPQGLELWASDGTAAGTRRLGDICTGSCGDLSYSLLVPLAGAAFYLGRDPVHGIELWRTDGTPEGTRRFTDLADDAPGIALDQLAAVGGQVYFSARDDQGGGLWRSDGQPVGTRLVSRIAADGDGSSPDDLVALGGRLLFTACNGHGRELWASDGTDAVQISSLSSIFGYCDDQEGPRDAVAAGGTAFFWTGRYSGPVLWASDGAGVTRLAGFDQYQATTPVTPLGGGAVFFPIQAADQTGQLWRSDGTPAGTRKVLDLPGQFDVPFNLTALGSDLYFFGYGGDGRELWRSDGTAAGTRLLLSGQLVVSFPPVRLGSAVFFFAETQDGADHLWRTDGTAAGTAIAADIPGGNPVSEPAHGAVVGGKLFFFLYGAGSSNGVQLWVTDGTPGGTSAVATWTAKVDQPEPTVFAGRLFFVADDGVHGRELWASDGTPAGTGLVADLAPGAAAGDPSGLAVARGRLFFSADDGVHGYELWATDGTGAGTRLVADVAPEADSSFPGRPTAAGDRLFFAADDGLHGRELWALPLASAGCQPSPGHLCLAGGRFRVEAEWRDFQGNAGRGTAVALTADTGYFWFFNPANVEVVVKVLDGRGVNQAFWVFYGALSSVEYTLTVTDTQTGLTRRYENPSGSLASVGDTHGFGPLGAFDVQKQAQRDTGRPRAAAPKPAATLVAARTDPRAAAAPCTAGADRLCLGGGRFAVTADWKDFQGHSGHGTAVPLTGDTGYFWFFDPANVEVVTKVLDGRPVNQKFWLFYGALSSVEYTLTVSDTQTGAVRTYRNASGNLASVADTSAF